MRIVFLFILFITISIISVAQNYELGNISGFNFNKSLHNNWKLNLALESRQVFFDGILNESLNQNYQYDRTELTILAARKTTLNQSLNFGYMIRFANNAYVHRFIQQYTILNKFEKFKLAHRVALNQTIKQNKPIELALRYRLGFEKPFSGLSVDPKEFYLKLNSEIIANFDKIEFSDAELRNLVGIGYALNNSNKIETGIDNRIQNLNLKQKSHELCIFITWYLSL